MHHSCLRPLAKIFGRMTPRRLHKMGGTTTKDKRKRGKFAMETAGGKSGVR